MSVLKLQIFLRGLQLPVNNHPLHILIQKIVSNHLEDLESLVKQKGQQIILDNQYNNLILIIVMMMNFQFQINLLKKHPKKSNLFVQTVKYNFLLIKQGLIQYNAIETQLNVKYVVK